MKFRIEVKIGKTWTPVRPPTEPPYEFGSRLEAETMARVLYRDEYRDPEVVRIVPDATT